MKGTPRSVWLSAANRAAGFWMGHAMTAAQRQQRLAAAEIAKAFTGKALTDPKRKKATRARKAKA